MGYFKIIKDVLLPNCSWTEVRCSHYPNYYNTKKMNTTPQKFWKLSKIKISKYNFFIAEINTPYDSNRPQRTL